MKITITEALAEIKTTLARIDKKREAVMRYFSRDGKLRDPLEQDGGSTEFVRRERQAIKDLEEKIVKIRSAIQTINSLTVLSVGNQTRTVIEWLNWRRDVAPKAKGFLTLMANQLNTVRQYAARSGVSLTESEKGGPTEIIITVNEQQLSKEIEEMEGTLGTLDGKLSLINATTFVDV